MTAVLRFLVGVCGLATVVVLALLVLLLPSRASGIALAGGVAIVAAAMGAALLVRRRLRRRFEVGAEILGSGLVVLAAILGAPPVLAGSVLAVGAACRVAAGLLARTAWRRSSALSGDPAVDVVLARVDRSLHEAAVAFAVGPVLVGLLLAAGTARPGRDPGIAVVFGLGFALLGASVAISVRSLDLRFDVAAATDRDRGAFRRISRAVLLGRHEFLTGTEEHEAVRYSRFAGRVVLLDLVRTIALVGGLVLMLGRTVLTGPPDPWLDVSGAIGAAVAITVVATIPLTVARVRRARAYALAHGTTVA